MAARNLKDKVVEEILEDTEAPNTLFTWYLIAGYCYYVCGVAIISQGLFDRAKARVISEWDSINTPLANPFSLADIKNEVGWNKLSASLQTTAKMHADSVSSGNRSTVPIVPPVSTPPRPKAAKHSDWSRLRVEGRIVLPYEATNNHKSQLDFICAELGFELYAGIMYAKSDNKADIAARVMRALDLLSEQSISYNSYTMVDVLIDSGNEDIWQLSKLNKRSAA